MVSVSFMGGLVLCNVKGIWLVNIHSADGRFASAQTALMLQEETIRRNERERKVMTDKLTNLERSLNASESEKKQQQDRIIKLKSVSYYLIDLKT